MIDKMAGRFMFAGMLLTIAEGFGIVGPSWLAGLLVWLAAALLIADASVEQKRISMALLFVGLIGWCWAFVLDIPMDWQKASSLNQSLITLFIGVHFLRLVALPNEQKEEKLPHGEKAFITTFLGVHCLGAVINLSSVVFVGDRISKNGRLSKAQATMLIRALAAAAFWSPFFAGFGAAMVFAEESSLVIVLLTGLFAALISALLSFYEFKKDKSETIESFSGFPLHFEAFKVPLLLSVLVLAAHALFPDFKVILLVALLSCLITLILLIRREGGGLAVKQFSSHISEKLPGMRGELMLYLSAGLLGSALSALIEGLSITLPITELTGTSSAVVLGCMLLAARLGVHPVISIAVVGGWFLSLDPNHTLLATLFLFSWGIGVCINPFSGINLMMLGRYGVKGKEIVQWNSLYSLKLYAIASTLLILQGKWLGL